MQRRGFCCHSVHGCMWRQGTWFALFVILSLFSGGLLFGSEKNPLCLHQRVVERLWCILVSPPTIINCNEDVPTHSSFPLKERWFPECWLKHMPITLTSFTLSSPLSSSLPTSTSTHQLLSDPSTSSLFTLPMSCDLAKVQVYVEIYLISIFTLKVRFIKPVWQSSAMILTSAPTALGLCLMCPFNWGWQSGAVHIGNEWLSRGWKRGHPSQNYFVLVLYLIWGRQSVLALNNGPTLLDQLPALFCDIALWRGNLWGAH